MAQDEDSEEELFRSSPASFREYERSNVDVLALQHAGVNGGAEVSIGECYDMSPSSAQH